MDDHTNRSEARENAHRALIREIRAVGAPCLASLEGELVAAEARGDTERARAVRADIATITRWLAWAAREERRIARGTPRVVSGNGAREATD